MNNQSTNNFENEQRAQSILRKNPAFIARYEQMKVLQSEQDSYEEIKGISDDEADDFAKSVKERYGFSFPADYLTFLKLSDGFSYFSIHGEFKRLHGIEYLSSNLKELMYGYVIGDYDDFGIPCNYKYAAKTGRFFSYDFGGGNLIYVFDTFFDMLDDFLGLEKREGGVYDDDNYELIRSDSEQETDSDDEEDSEKEFLRYLEEAKKGDADAQYYLAILYSSGDYDDYEDEMDDEIEEDKVYYWMRRAAEQDHQDALEWFADLRSDMGAEAWD